MSVPLKDLALKGYKICSLPQPRSLVTFSLEEVAAGGNPIREACPHGLAVLS